MAPSMKLLLLGQTLLAASGAQAALNVNFDDQSSIKAAASVVAKDLMSFYKGNQPGGVPGILPGPPPDGDYYWWAGGLLWDTLLEYSHRSGDDQFNDLIRQGLQWQMGDAGDFMARNWTASMGNDDQAVWGLASLSAASVGLKEANPEDSNGTTVTWTEAAHNVFGTQSARVIQNGTCEDLLRWQIYPFNAGYDYVNSAANAAHFAMGAELAYITKNQTAGEQAAETYDAVSSIGLIDDQFNVFDGVHAPKCKDVNKVQMSMAAGLMIQGAAFMYNHTDSSEEWKQRLDGLLSRTLEVFFFNDIVVEPSCEAEKKCNTDMKLFRGVLLRGLAAAAQYAPHTAARIDPKLRATARAAAASCSGGEGGRRCGFAWTAANYDDQPGAAAQMNALSALTSIMAPAAPVDLTARPDPEAAGDQPKENAAAAATGSHALAVVLGGLALAAWNLL